MYIKPLQFAHYACLQYIKILALHTQETLIKQTLL